MITGINSLAFQLQASSFTPIESSSAPSLDPSYGARVSSMNLPPTCRSTLSDPARLAELKGTKLLDSCAEVQFDRITQLAAQALKVPVCLVSLVDDRRQFFKSMVGLTGWAAEKRETPLSYSFCQHVVATGAPLIVEDAPANPLVCGNPAISELGLKAYLGMPIRSPNGLVLGSLCVIDTAPRSWSPGDIELLRNLTLLVETEILLRAAIAEKDKLASRQTALLHSTTFSVIATSPDGVIEFFNQGAENMLGYTSAEMVGRHTPEIMHDAEEISVVAAELSRQFGRDIKPGFEVFIVQAQHGDADEREWTYVRKDGGRLPVRLTVTALTDDGGNVTGYLGIASNESERREARQQLAQSNDLLGEMGKLAQVGGWALDLQSMALVWTRETFRIHELDALENPTIADAVQFYTPESRPRIENAVRHCIASGEGWDLELTLITAKGRRIWVRAQGRAVLKDGRPERLVGAFQDITVRKALEESLAEARDQALSASRLKSEFLANMSH